MATSLSSVRLTTIAENMLTITPMASVAAKPCTTVAPSVSANQNSIAQVISVEKLPSLMAGQARLKPMFIDVSSVRPARSSSFIRSNIRMFASTAIPTERMAAARPDSVRVTGKILKIASISTP